MSGTASGRGSIVGLAVTMMLGSLGVSLPYVALPTLSEAFGVSLQAVQWIVTSYLLAVTTLVVGVGRLGDIFGPRKVLLAGLSLFMLATVVCAAAPTFWVLDRRPSRPRCGSRGSHGPHSRDRPGDRCQGQDGPCHGPAGDHVGNRDGARAQPWRSAQLQFGWRAIFLALIPLSALSLALVLVSSSVCATAPRRSTAAFDAAGTLLLGLSAALYALALSGVTGGWSSAGLLLLASVGIVGFVLVEQRVEAPLVQLAMMRDAKLVAGLTSNMLTSAVMMATLVVGPFYLSRGLGLDVDDRRCCRLGRPDRGCHQRRPRRFHRRQVRLAPRSGCRPCPGARGAAWLWRCFLALSALPATLQRSPC